MDNYESPNCLGAVLLEVIVLGEIILEGNFPGGNWSGGGGGQYLRAIVWGAIVLD